MPRNPSVPATLLARLAVDRHQQKRGLGKFLLLEAEFRALEVAESAVGSAAMIVDAKDEDAAQFYERYDFIRFPTNRLKLCLPMATIRKAFV